jgi:predicted nucleotidyltransferase
MERIMVVSADQVNEVTMTSREVMKCLNVSKSRVCHLGNSGHIERLKGGGFYRPSVEAYKAKRGTKKAGRYSEAQLQRLGEGALSLKDMGAIIAPIADAYNIKSVYVFGSYARGEETPTSDIDLLVGVDPSAKVGIFEIIGFRQEAESSFNRKVDVVTTGALAQGSMGKRVVESIENEKRSIYERTG